MLGLSGVLYITVKRYNKGKELVEGNEEIKSSSRRCLWGLAIIAFAVLIGGSLSLFLSTSWISLDAWGFIPYASLSSRLHDACFSYMSHVSRSGEFVLHLIGISENQWQSCLFTPIAYLLIPVAMLRLIGERNTALLSRKGFLFFSFSLLLLIISSNIRKHSFCNFFQLPIAANYLWPLPFVFYFLSCYRKKCILNAESSDVVSYVKRMFIFVMGLFACWGPECVCVMIIPIVTAWGVYTMCRREKIAESCLWGYLGALWGAFLLFASPALQNRALVGKCCRNVDFGEMSSAELERYFRSLDIIFDVSDFKDGTHCVNFSDLPLHYHLYFLPRMSLTLWGCGQLVLAVFAVLFIFACAKKYQNRGRIIMSSLLVLCGGYVCASSYLMSCIPTAPSFHPPVIAFALAAAVLFYHLPYRLLPQLMLIVGMAGYILYVLAPVGIEQWNYKRYETERFAEIHRQQQEGEEYIVLPHPSVNLPDSFGMLAQHQLEEGFDGYPNTAAAKRYGVKGLRQKKKGEE